MHHFLSLACLLACLHSAPLGADDDDGEKNAQEPATTHTAASATGQDAVSMAKLKTQILQSVRLSAEVAGLAVVVDPEPLLAMRQHYLSAQAQQSSANAKYRESEFNLSRTRQLHAEAIVPTRRLQEQEARLQSDKADMAASGYLQQSLLGASRLQWGEVLTDWFTGDSHSAQAFLNGRAQLLLATLPATFVPHDDVGAVYVDELGRRDHAVAATLISPAPQVDPINQGRRYFLKLEGRPLPFGAQLTVWLAENQSQQTTGVVVPDSAVIWHLGQAMVFVKNDDGAYARRVLAEFTPWQGGYFTANSLRAGEEIVVTGAQTLLSQELKNQIPSEDKD